MREELGLPVRLTHLSGVYSEPGNPVVLVVYTGEVSGEATPTIQEEEISAVGYFRPTICRRSRSHTIPRSSPIGRHSCAMAGRYCPNERSRHSYR